MTDTTTNSTRGIERRSIDPVPASERHGRPFNQFTLWFGANMQVTAPAAKEEAAVEPR